jgi:hypothetical protein
MNNIVHPCKQAILENHNACPAEVPFVLSWAAKSMVTRAFFGWVATAA